MWKKWNSIQSPRLRLSHKYVTFNKGTVSSCWPSKMDQPASDIDMQPTKASIFNLPCLHAPSDDPLLNTSLLLDCKPQYYNSNLSSTAYSHPLASSLPRSSSTPALTLHLA